MNFIKFNQNELFGFLKNHHFIFDIENFEQNFFQHLLFYGHSNFNKIDLIRFLLYSYYSYKQKLLYNNTDIVFHIEKNSYNISNNLNNFTSKNDQIQLHINKSPIHWEIDFNFTGNNTNNQLNRNQNDYYILQFIINFLCKSINLQNDCGLEKIIVFNHISKLKLKYQKMLFQTMEKYYSNIKFIFITNQLNRVENSLISRTMLVRLPLFYNIIDLNYPYKFIKTNFYKNIYQIYFYIIFSKNNRYIYAITFDNQIYDTDNVNCNKLILEYIQSSYDDNKKSLIAQYDLFTTDKFFNKFNDTIISFIECNQSNLQKLYYQHLIQFINNYFMDCHYMNEFFNEWLESLKNNKLQYHVLKSNNSIFSLIADIEYKSLFSDYNNYLMENFISNLLYILLYIS